MVNRYDVTEYECDSPQVNVWYALMKNKFMGPFYFEKITMTGSKFLLCIMSLCEQ
jgi:hypothetical protein